MSPCCRVMKESEKEIEKKLHKETRKTATQRRERGKNNVQNETDCICLYACSMKSSIALQ